MSLLTQSPLRMTGFKKKQDGSVRERLVCAHSTPVSSGNSDVMISEGGPLGVRVCQKGGALINVTRDPYYKSQLSDTLLSGCIQKVTVCHMGKHFLNLLEPNFAGSTFQTSSYIMLVACTS